jgi:hypothetical protein
MIGSKKLYNSYYFFDLLIPLLFAVYKFFCWITNPNAAWITFSTIFEEIV